MANLKFADTHNMVAFLSKPEESDGFEQIVDFLNAHPIKYALTVNPTIYISCIKQFWSTVKAKTINGEVQLHALVDGKKVIITEVTVRRDLQLEDEEGVDCLPNSTIFEQLTLMGSKTTTWNEFSSTMASAIIYLATNQKFNFSKYIFESMVKNLDNLSRKFLMYPRRSKRKDIEVPQPSGPTTNVADEAVNEEMDDSLVKAATTASSLEAEQDSGNINKTQSKATPNEPSSPGTSSGSGPKRQETMGDTITQTRFENVSKLSNDPLLARGNTFQSGEDSLKLQELMELCITLQSRVLNLETIKTTQANEIASLKRRVKKLEQKKRSRTHGLKRLYKVGSSRRVESSEDEGLGEEDASKQGRIADIDANKDIYLVNVQTDEDMFGVNDLDGDEVIVESVDVVNTAEETRSVVEEVTAVTIPVSAATTTTTTTAITDVEMTLAQALAELKSAKPKADKVVIQEPEQGTTTPTLTTTTDATTITAVSTRPRAKGLVIHEQEQAPTPTVSSQQPSQVKVQDKEQRRNFAAKRAEEKRNRPPTRAQQRRREVPRSRSRVAMRSSLKSSRTQESSKKQKLEEDKESEELKQCLEIIPDDGDYMLKNFNIEDLEVLWSIVKARFKKTEPVNYMDNFLLLNLKTMFEHHVEDNNMLFYLLVEKIYPLTNHTLHQMFNDVKLQVDYECEMAFELLRLVKKQLKEGYGRIVGIKSLLEVTAAKVCVTAAKQNTASVKLVLLVKIEENILSSYYCLYTVNAAGV
ncbi:hypothetical protein Tco_0384842 [Tanacetum coccineum]